MLCTFWLFSFSWFSCLSWTTNTMMQKKIVSWISRFSWFFWIAHSIMYKKTKQKSGTETYSMHVSIWKMEIILVSLDSNGLCTHNLVSVILSVNCLNSRGGLLWTYNQFWLKKEGDLPLIQRWLVESSCKDLLTRTDPVDGAWGPCTRNKWELCVTIVLPYLGWERHGTGPTSAPLNKKYVSWLRRWDSKFHACIKFLL